jgi:hypothetical protein
VFETLMATRSARLSSEHVRALNSIELAFHGVRVLGKGRRMPASQMVLDRWNEYLQHLNSGPVGNPAPANEISAWVGAGHEKFVNLLEALAKATNYDFDRATVTAGVYNPVAHGNIEADNESIRKSLVQVLRGTQALSLDVKSLPVDPQFVESQQAWQLAVTTLLQEILAQIQVDQASEEGNDTTAN